MLQNANGDVVRANFIEKILATVLAKLSNFVPEGGIWMNTQRPEWNDANNALVGNGISMVTLYYLRRFLKFFDDVFENTTTDTVEVSVELLQFFNEVKTTFDNSKALLNRDINDTDRKQILDALGKAGSDYRSSIYNSSFSGKKDELGINEVKSFTKSALAHLEHSIEANKRSDNLYHAYNLMTVESNNNLSISYLSEMLEGQVAVLSSGYLSSKENLTALDALKQSKLFREDQYSYILYPFKDLKGFMERNTISAQAITNSKLLQQLLEDGNTQIIEKDITGKYHFNGNFKNAGDLKVGLKNLKNSTYQDLVHKEEKAVLQVFEDVFNHKAFTGRSGTFYGYEGLGSIYWHMVSKLQLAVLECCLKAINNKESDAIVGRLLEHYYEINEGIGVHKSPELYGAFPTDPYSHTPTGKGAQQPGMTGQVKEDILSRFGELGVFVTKGKLYFYPCMLRKVEFLAESKIFNYVTIENEKSQLQLSEGELSFTYCQVPVVYKISQKNSIEVKFKDSTIKTFQSLSLDEATSKSVFSRLGEVTEIRVNITEDYLK